MTRLIEPNQLIDLAGERRISRRGLLGALAAAGVAMSGPFALPRPARAEGQPLYFTWGGYDVPGMFSPFTEQYGAPETAAFADASEALQKIRAGYVCDIVHPCIADIRRYRAADMFTAFDADKLSNWGDVFAPMRSLPGQIDEDGRVWLVPCDWGATAITVRTDLIDMSQKEASYGLLWDQELAGRIAMIIGMSDSWFVGAILEGVDVTKPEDITEEEIQRVNSKLREQQPLVKLYWSDNTTMDQALATGEVVAALTWNATAPRLRKQGVQAEFIAPKEGALTWSCGLMLHKDAPNPEAAHKLVDAMLDPAVGEFLIRDFGYGHSNSRTFKVVPEDVLNEMGVPTDPIAFLNDGHFLTGMPEDLSTRLNRDWEQIMAGF